MTLEPKETKYVYVDACSWYSGYPSIDVERGQSYSFKVNPLHRWKSGFISYNAKGASFIRSKLAKPRYRKGAYHSLCATIDRNEDLHFEIGLYIGVKEMRATGQLLFFVNKNISEYSGGTGHVIVEIERLV